MSDTILYKRSWMDLIFRKKNQNYGAFELRQVYDKNVMIGLLIAIAIFVVSLSLPLIIKLLGSKDNVIEAPQVVEVKLEEIKPMDPKTPPPPPPPKIEIPKSVAAQIAFLPPKVEPDEQVVDEPPTIDDIKDKVISTQNVEGTKGDNEIEVIESTGTGTGPVEVAKEEPFLVVEQMPEFPGGELEMKKFITNNFKYPAQALQMEVQGKVYVQFVVSASGKISDITIIKGIGSGCDQEAARVVGMMPNWSAGRQNGRSVPVRFTIPIKLSAH